MPMTGAYPKYIAADDADAGVGAVSSSVVMGAATGVGAEVTGLVGAMVSRVTV